ncbi:MAG: YebC/PmpR family DNA-binding transcriptional regulator [Parcubacteria group bacterium]|nr:YebC/PmpR family DNA-binding transcriptional regulator [Parcubacteria group bacterium]
MSGHSRWSQIKHKKATTDEKRGQLFGKLAKKITIAAKNDPDPETNIKLKSIIEYSRQFNMPGENIQRAIQRASKKDGVQLETLILEAVGSNNINLLIQAITDNRNRTIAEIRLILANKGFKLVPEGSIKWQFETKGFIELTLPNNINKETLELKLIETGIDNIDFGENIFLYTKPNQLEEVKRRIKELGFETQSSGLGYVNTLPIKIKNEAEKTELINVLSILENHDDVEEVYSNVDF